MNKILFDFLNSNYVKNNHFIRNAYLIIMINYTKIKNSVIFII